MAHRLRHLEEDDIAIGLDLAKNVFELFGFDAAGRTALRRHVQRASLLETIAQLPPCVVGIEACTSAFYWLREFEKFGHTVEVISPQYVKPRAGTRGSQARP